MSVFLISTDGRFGLFASTYADNLPLLYQFIPFAASHIAVNTGQILRNLNRGKQKLPPRGAFVWNLLQVVGQHLGCLGTGGLFGGVGEGHVIEEALLHRPLQGVGRPSTVVAHLAEVTVAVGRAGVVAQDDSHLLDGNGVIGLEHAAAEAADHLPKSKDRGSWAFSA